MLTAFLAAALATLAVDAPAPTPAPRPPELTRYAGLAIDPQASRIVTVESRQAKGAPTSGHGVIVIRDTSGKVITRFDPCDTCRYDGLAWSPDGSRLAFVASGGGGASLYVYEKEAVRKVTGVIGLAATPRWSPDGQTIAFLATEDAHKESGATQPGVRQVGLIGTTDDARRIAVVPLTGGPYRKVSPPRIFIYEYDWMPNGEGFVGTAAEGNGDNQWWVATLRSFGLSGGMRIIASPPEQMNFPRVSPDGRTVAYIGGLMSDFGSVGGDVYVVPITGGTPRNLTDGYKASFTSLDWRGSRLLVSAIVSGSSALGTIDAASGKVALGEVLPQSLAAGDAAFAADASGARAAYVTESFTKGPSIAFGTFGQGRSISHENDALRADVVPHDIRWKKGSNEVQGWLLEPTGQDISILEQTDAAGKRSPVKAAMVTVIHGGPAAAVTPRFPWSDVLPALSNHGYWIFQPNPRGSYGYGEAVVRANVKDFGGGDLEDILAGIDQVEKLAPIDDEKLGVYGHSYGGYMTMWTVTHSQRFKAAVAGAGIANWVSYYGQNGIDQWMIPYFGASVYDDPKVYDRLSPIRSIKDAKTPTFLYVGERDVECPPAQSLEFWHGLRAMNVPSELMIYADEGHGIREAKNLRDREERMLGWYDKYLKGM